MKKFLLIIILCVCGILPTLAQTLQFKTRAYSYKQLTSYGWTNWSSWEDSNMYLTINLDTDIVTIYSPVTQIYKIIDYSNPYYEGTAQCIDYHFYDQDGDRGTMTLAVKASGQSEVYIRFRNIQWAYVVTRM